MMTRIGPLTILLLASAMPTLGAAQQDSTVKIVNVVELSGDGKIAGTNFNNGAQLAFKEINAAGGILGQPVEVTILDSQTSLERAQEMVTSAVEQKPYAIMGPVFSGSVLASMDVIAAAKIPSFIGAEAAEITQKGNPYIFRTSFTQATAMPKLASYIKSGLRADSVAMVWINNPFGKGGHNEMLKALEAEGIELAGDFSTEPGQKDYVEVVQQLDDAEADAAFIYLNEAESADILKELYKQNYGKPIIGETTLLGQQVIDLAGTAANGVLGHVGLTPEALIPTVRDFDNAFTREYGYRSDHNGMKGYIGAYTLKAVTEKVGTLDQESFAQAMKGVTLRAADNPGVLLDVKYDDNGDLDRVSFIVRVVGGKHQFIATVPALDPELKSGMGEE